MSKFVNTSYTKAVNNISEAAKTFINNPYYMWSDKKPTIVTYYSINMEKSTLDEAARIPYNDIGQHSPLRYNRIKDFVIYGLDRITLSMEAGDFGLEAGEVNGDAVILPGTIKPSPNDYFEINILEDSWLFRVTEVNLDTLDDRSNIWKISYSLEHDNNKELTPLVIDDYTLMINNVGTRYTAILKTDKYDIISAIDNICSVLKQYYISLFYRPQVQTFVFNHLADDMYYDSYLIEFLIRNKILEGASNDPNDYIYIDHKITPIKTFALDYNRTFFKCLEDKDIKSLANSKMDSTCSYIDDFGSIFASRAENYYRINYNVPSYNIEDSGPAKYNDVLTMFPKKIIPYIQSNNPFTQAEILMNPMYGLYNILIKYFNNSLITEEDYHNLEKMDFDDSLRFFYLIPMIILCLEDFIKTTLEKKAEDKPYKIGEETVQI